MVASFSWGTADALSRKAYYGNSHSALIQQFYQAVSSDSQDYVHTDDAAISIFMIDAIRRSSETGETIYL